MWNPVFKNQKQEFFGGGYLWEGEGEWRINIVEPFYTKV
jgi:hypothetical protein